jgi:hypothetical protein
MARDLTVNRTAVDSDKYVYREERDLSKTQVDWGTVSKNLTDTINTIRDNRQTEKDEIETANTEAMERAAEFDQYNNKTLNESVLEGSEWAREALTIQMDLTRRGLVTPSERKRYEQRVSDSFTSLKKNVDSFSKDFDESTRRANAKESTTLEQAINGSVAGLGVLKTWQLSGNTATGELAYVRAGNDPATGKPYDLNNPSNQASLGTIGVRVTSRVNYTSTTEAAQAEVEHLAEIIDETLLANQAVKSVEDWSKLENSKGMMEGMVNSLTATSAQLASIAQDRLSFTMEAYNQDWTDEQLAADPDKVRLIPDPMGSGDLIADFSPEQIIRIKKAAELSLESQIDQKIKFTKGFTKQQATSTTIGAGDKEAISVWYMQDIIDLTEGDAKTAKSAADALASTINKSLGADDAPVTLLERVVDSEGVTLAFQVHRKGMNPTTVNVKDMSPKDAQRALYENVTPEGVLGYHDAVDAWGGTSGVAYGVGGVQGRGPTKKMTTLDFERNLEIPGTADTMTAYQYVDSQLGEVFGSGNSYDEAIDAYKTVLTSMMPKDLFNAVGGSDNVEVSFQGDTLVIKIGEGEDMVKKTVSYSSGENDSTRLHLDTIQEAISEAREKAIARKTGESSQVSYDEWLVENPSGSFAEWFETQ